MFPGRILGNGERNYVTAYLLKKGEECLSISRFRREVPHQAHRYAKISQARQSPSGHLRLTISPQQSLPRLALIRGRG